MAFSHSLVDRQMVGGLVMEIHDLNFASVTEGIIRTGLSDVLSAVFNNEVTEDQGLVKRNTSTGSDTANGAVFINGVTSSDTGRLVVHGRP